MSAEQSGDRLDSKVTPGPAALAALLPTAPAQAVLALRFQLQYDDVAAFVASYAVNLSPGGMFIAAREFPAVGTRLRFVVVLADERPVLRGEGQVVWTAGADLAAQADPGANPLSGIGVRFHRLDAASRAVLAQVLAHKAAHPNQFFTQVPDPYASAVVRQSYRTSAMALPEPDPNDVPAQPVASAASAQLALGSASSQLAPSAGSAQSVPSSTSSQLASSAASSQSVPSSASSQLASSAASSQPAPSSASSQLAPSSASSQPAPSSASSQSVPSSASSQSAPSSASSQSAPSSASSQLASSSAFSQPAPSAASSQSVPSSASSQPAPSSASAQLVPSSASSQLTPSSASTPLPTSAELFMPELLPPLHGLPASSQWTPTGAALVTPEVAAEEEAALQALLQPVDSSPLPTATEAARMLEELLDRRLA